MCLDKLFNICLSLLVRLEAYMIFVTNATNIRVNFGGYVRSGNLQLPCVQPPTSLQIQWSSGQTGQPGHTAQKRQTSQKEQTYLTFKLEFPGNLFYTEIYAISAISSMSQSHMTALSPFCFSYLRNFRVKLARLNHNNPH